MDLWAQVTRTGEKTSPPWDRKQFPQSSWDDHEADSWLEQIATKKHAKLANYAELRYKFLKYPKIS